MYNTYNICIHMYIMYGNQLSQKVTNSLIFSLSQNIFIAPLPLKDIFAGFKSSLKFFFLIFQSSAQFLLTSIFVLLSQPPVSLLLLL